MALLDVVARERRLSNASQNLLQAVRFWMGVGVLLLFGLGLVLYFRLYRPLGALDTGLERVAAGDLEVRIPVGRRDELGRLEAHFNDMTEVLRLRAEEEQQRTHNLAERLGRLLEESLNEVFVFDRDTWRFLQVNRGAERNSGFTQEQLLARTPIDLLPEFDEKRFAELLAPLEDGTRGMLQISTHLRRADGSTYPVEGSIQLSRSEQPPVYHAIVRDVSDRLKAEAERDRMFDLSVDLLAVGTFDGYLTRVNRAWERATGFTTDELTGRMFLDFVHPEDRDLTRRQLLALRDGEAIRGTSIRLLCKDGGVRWTSWNADPPKDGMIYAVGRDVTDRRAAEQRQAELQVEVARAAREWTMTFDALDDPVIIVNREAEAIRVNEAARRLTGMAHRDMLGRRLTSYSDDELWWRATDLAYRACASGKPASTQVRSRNGSRVWDLEVSPVGGAAVDRSAAIVIAHDVTPVVRLQDSVRRNEAMAAMGTLVGGVAHEVRNPLFSMTATLDAFEARAGKERGGEKHIAVLRGQLERLQVLMRDLLEYGRPQQLHLEPTPFGIIVQQAVEEVGTVAAQRNVRLETEVDTSLPPVRADRARLVQVYVNLFMNAVQHSPEGASVQLSATGISENGASWLETVVQDAGPGFAPDDLPRVFEPFFTKRRGGTGLGLALVQRIVEQHGGQVVAENVPGAGGAVRVRLPLVAAS